MVYVFLIVQLAVSIGVLALFAIASAFQDEYLRWSTPAMKAIDITILLVLLTPLLLTLVSFTRVVRGKAPLLTAPIWFAAFLTCGVTTIGLLTLKEKVGYAARNAAREKHRAELLAAAQGGDGAKACELVGLGPGAPLTLFPICKKWIEEASTPSERLARLENFTSGRWLKSWEEDGRMVCPVPPSEQVWFVRTYFNALLEAAPGSSAQKPAANEAFDDLLVFGASLSGIGRPEVLTHEALCALAELIPTIEAQFAARLTAATTQNPERATYFKSVVGDARTRAGNCAP